MTEALRLLWAKVRLWLLRRTQRVLRALANKNRAGERLPAAERLSSSDAASQSLRGSPLSSEADSCPWRVSDGAVELAEGEDFASNLDKEEGSVHRYFGSLHGSSRGSNRGSYGNLDGSVRAAAAVALEKERKRVSGDDEPGSFGPPPSEFCAVCHDDFTLPCQANCGHWFCGESPFPCSSLALEAIAANLSALSIYSHARGSLKSFLPCYSPV